MRYTKTTAVLLAVSMFLAGCGGSTGIAASGAGMTAFMVPGTIEDYAFKRDVLAIFKEKPQIRLVFCTNFRLQCEIFLI